MISSAIALALFWISPPRIEMNLQLFAAAEVSFNNTVPYSRGGEINTTHLLMHFPLKYLCRFSVS